MSDNLTKLVQEEIDSGIGDIGRLQFILNSLKKGKTLCLCDQKYLKTRISRRVEEKRFILKDETENVIKNNENQKIIMTTNFQDCSTNLGQDKQTSLFLNKSEMITGSDIQKVILKVKKNLESTLERIEKLQRTFREKSKFELVEPKVDQNYLPNKSHDITEKQKSNNTDVKISGKNENKLKTDENTRTITKVLLVITIVTIVSTFVVLWFFGILEGKSKWQDYGLSYSDASTIVRYFLFATILTLVAWPAFGISRIIIYKRK